MSIKEVQKEPLKPIEIKNDPYPYFKKGNILISATFACTAFGAVSGSSLALVGVFEVTIIVAATAGGVIGLATGLVLSHFLIKNYRSPLQHYRIETLDQIANDQPNLAEWALKLKEYFSQKDIVFKWGAEHHALHDYATKITLSEEMRTRAGLKEVWRKFLTLTDSRSGIEMPYSNGSGIELSYPQGPKHRLDFSMELERLEGNNIPLQVEFLKKNLFAAEFEMELERIVKLEIDADGWNWSLEPYQYNEGGSIKTELGLRKRFLFKNPADECILVRHAGSKELLGALWYEFKEGNEVHICVLERDARAAQLKIGTKLLEALFNALPLDRTNITLNVRAKNIPAVKLYEHHGFVISETYRNWYKLPRDDAYLMRFNYQKYLAAQERARQAV